MHNPLPRPSVTSWTQSGNRQTFIFLFTVWAEHKMIIKNITYSSFESPYKSLRYEKRSGGVRRGGRERRYEAGLSCLICSICAKECRVEERRTQRDDGRRIPRHYQTVMQQGALQRQPFGRRRACVCVCVEAQLFSCMVSVFEWGGTCCCLELEFPPSRKKWFMSQFAFFAASDGLLLLSHQI